MRIRGFSFLMTAATMLSLVAVAGSASRAAASTPAAASPRFAASGTAPAAVHRLAAPAAPQGLIACAFGVDKPFFLTTKSNKMYSKAGITGCTSPAPQACKLTVELQAKNGPLWITVAQNVTKWQSCGKRSPLSTKPPFICHGYPEKTEFAGQATLQVEINGTYKSDTIGSGVVSYYCAP